MGSGLPSRYKLISNQFESHQTGYGECDQIEMKAIAISDWKESSLNF